MSFPDPLVMVRWVAQRRLAWLRRQYDDLVETLAQLHDQDMQHVTGISIPAEVLSAAETAAAAMALPPARAAHTERASEQRTVPNAPFTRPPRPPPQPAASVALSQSRPKHGRMAGWVMQSLHEASGHADVQHRKRMKMRSTAVVPGQRWHAHQTESGAGGSTPAQSLQQGSCCEWEDFDEHDPLQQNQAEARLLSPCMDSARAQGMELTQPNEVLASQRNSRLEPGVPVPVLRPPACTAGDEVDSSI